VEEGEQRRKQRELKRCAAFTAWRLFSLRAVLLLVPRHVGARVLLALESARVQSLLWITISLTVATGLLPSSPSSGPPPVSCAVADWNIAPRVREPRHERRV
jgi:hypothetical protein